MTENSEESAIRQNAGLDDKDREVARLRRIAASQMITPIVVHDLSARLNYLSLALRRLISSLEPREKGEHARIIADIETSFDEVQDMVGFMADIVLRRYSSGSLGDCLRHVSNNLRHHPQLRHEHIKIAVAEDLESLKVPSTSLTTAISHVLTHLMDDMLFENVVPTANASEIVISAHVDENRLYVIIFDKRKRKYGYERRQLLRTGKSPKDIPNQFFPNIVKYLVEAYGGGVSTEFNRNGNISISMYWPLDWNKDNENVAVD